MNESLARVFDLREPAVAIAGGEYPTIDKLSVTLDGAVLRDDPPRPVKGERPTGNNVDVRDFKVAGSGVQVAGGALNLSITGTDVRMNVGEAGDGALVLMLSDAGTGRVEVSTTKAALEKVIGEIAKREAGKHGVTVDGVELSLRQNGPRSLAAEVKLRARKLFLSASIRLSGRLDIDDAMDARLSELKCEGDGAIASVACGVLGPLLEKANGRKLTVVGLPLGNVALRDVRISAADQIELAADFGRA